MSDVSTMLSTKDLVVKAMESYAQEKVREVKDKHTISDNLKQWVLRMNREDMVKQIGWMESELITKDQRIKELEEGLSKAMYQLEQTDVNEALMTLYNLNK
jgi:hypothetical protein